MSLRHAVHPADWDLFKLNFFSSVLVTHGSHSRCTQSTQPRMGGQVEVWRGQVHAARSLVTFNVIAANHAPAQLTAYGGQAPALRPAVGHGCLERPDVSHAAWACNSLRSVEGPLATQCRQAEARPTRACHRAVGHDGCPLVACPPVSRLALTHQEPGRNPVQPSFLQSQAAAEPSMRDAPGRSLQHVAHEQARHGVRAVERALRQRTPHLAFCDQLRLWTHRRHCAVQHLRRRPGSGVSCHSSWQRWQCASGRAGTRRGPHLQRRLRCALVRFPGRTVELRTRRAWLIFCCSHIPVSTGCRGRASFRLAVDTQLGL